MVFVCDLYALSNVFNKIPITCNFCSSSRELVVTRKIVTRDRGGGSQLASVTNVLHGGRGVKNGPNLCYVVFERSH